MHWPSMPFAGNILLKSIDIAGVKLSFMPPVSCEGRMRCFLRFRSATKSFWESIPSSLLPSPTSASGLFGRGDGLSPSEFRASSIGHRGNDDPLRLQVLLSMLRLYGPELLTRRGFA